MTALAQTQIDSAGVELMGLTTAELQALFASLGEKPFRATQVLKWIHQHGVLDFDAMSNLSQALRQQLRTQCTITPLEVAYFKESLDGTCKWLLRLHDGNIIETVYIPETTRGTLCVSSQVGCALNCSFCSTGKQGFNRNLTAAEIIGQVWHAVNYFREQQSQQRVTNVVMMGMGEPLLNFDAVVAAMDIMLDDNAYGLSKYRVTLSTSGIVPAMYELAQVSPVALAVSLHAPNDSLRDELVPINKKYPLRELMKACCDYFSPDEKKRKVTFEYVMLAGVNDQLIHAKQLVKLLHRVPAKMNLIPFNPFPHTHYQCSSPEQIQTFQRYLIDKGVHTIVRKTRGQDIDAACGQLAGDIKDKTSRNRLWKAKVAQ